MRSTKKAFVMFCHFIFSSSFYPFMRVRSGVPKKAFVVFCHFIVSSFYPFMTVRSGVYTKKTFVEFAFVQVAVRALSYG